jgi:hypothetical protein
MASARDIVVMYMAVASHDPKEAEANVQELANRNQLPNENRLSPGIHTRQLKLLQVVQSLQDYLVNEDLTKRQLGNGRDENEVDVAFGCLTGLIGAFAKDTLSRHEIDVLATFYCERLADEVVTKENVSGLTILVNMSACGEELAKKICLAFAPLCRKFDVVCLRRWICRNTYRRLVLRCLR